MLTCQALKESTHAPTMNHTRRELPPVASNKRKEKEIFDFLKPSTIIAKPSAPKFVPPPRRVPASKPADKPVSTKSADFPAPQNQLLAGYFAHEFLTKGTLCGQPYDPARTGAVPVSYVKTLPQALLMSRSSPKVKAEPSQNTSEPDEQKSQRYREVADLLKGNGPHLPSIVNPTQLARFLDL